MGVFEELYHGKNIEKVIGKIDAAKEIKDSIKDVKPIYLSLLDIKAEKLEKKDKYNKVAEGLAPLYYGVLPFYDANTGEFLLKPGSDGKADEQKKKQVDFQLDKVQNEKKLLDIVYTIIANAGDTDGVLEGLSYTNNKMEPDKYRTNFLRMESLAEQAVNPQNNLNNFLILLNRKQDIKELLYNKHPVEFKNKNEKKYYVSIMRSNLIELEQMIKPFAVLKGLLSKENYEGMIKKLSSVNEKGAPDEATRAQGMKCLIATVKNYFESAIKYGDMFATYKNAYKEIIDGEAAYFKARGAKDKELETKPGLHNLIDLGKNIGFIEDDKKKKKK